MVSPDSPISILMVHGIRTSATMWRHQAERLRELGHPVLAIDLPGHGTRQSEEFTVAAALTAIDEGVRTLGGPVLLVGLSLGGYYAIAYAAAHPERIVGLVAAGCSAVPRGPLLGGYRALARAIRRLPDHGLWLHVRMVKAMLPPRGAADVLAGGVALEVMDAGLLATSTLDPLRSLAAYPGPVWLVNGAFDHFRLNEARFLAACRNGSLIVIPRASHLVSLAQPERFETALEHIVAGLGSRRAGSLGRRPD